MNEKNCPNRREFLVKTTATTGGLVLSLAGLNAPQAQTKDDDDVTLKLDEKNPLSQVGGAYFFDYKGDKIVVIRRSETEFAAYSAICTHQGGFLNYNEKNQELVCPLHNSRFGTD